MKYLITLSFLTLLSFPTKAQYTLSVEAGYSDYITEPRSDASALAINDIINFKPSRSLRVTFDRRFAKEKIIGVLGMTYYNVKAKNFFFDTWTNTFLGIHLGAEYKIKNLRLGLHSYPAFRWDTSTHIASLGERLGGKQRFPFHVDINPSVGYAISKKLMAKLSFAYGLNKPIKTGRYDYRINALRIGFQYEIFRKKKNK